MQIKMLLYNVTTGNNLSAFRANYKTKGSLRCGNYQTINVLYIVCTKIQVRKFFFSLFPNTSSDL